MQLLFTKCTGKYDRLEIRRSSTTVETIQCPKQGIIPHDMVHYVVERTLKTRGFLYRVKEGEAANFRMKAEDHSDGVERLVEVIQADQWSGGTSAAADILDLYQTTCKARGCLPLDVDEQAVAAVRSEFASLSERWSEVPIGGTMELNL